MFHKIPQFLRPKSEKLQFITFRLSFTSIVHLTGQNQLFTKFQPTKWERNLYTMSNLSSTTIPPTLHAPDGWKSITEGSATVLYRDVNQVFYNPVQIFNRDLSIAVIQMWDRMRRKHANKKQRRREWINREKWRKSTGRPVQQVEDNHQDLPGLRILEALSASGLRSVRYAQEIPNIEQLLVNDLDAAAVDAIRRNLEFNQLDAQKIVPNEGDAIEVMFSHRKEEMQFDVVDLDPYGSAAPFLETAIQSVRNGGLLAVTCTDMPVLAGNSISAAFSKYGCVLPKARYCHELALRAVLGSISTTAARHRRIVTPLLCVSVDFYIRMFLVVRDSAATALLSPLKMGQVWQCSNCDSFAIQPMARLLDRPKEKLSAKAKRRKMKNRDNVDQITQASTHNNQSVISNTDNRQKDDETDTQEDTTKTDTTKEQQMTAVEQQINILKQQTTAVEQQNTTVVPGKNAAYKGFTNAFCDDVRPEGRVVPSWGPPRGIISTSTTDTTWQDTQDVEQDSVGACSHCHGRVQIAGPVWTAPLHDPNFVQVLLHEIETTIDHLEVSNIPSKDTTESVTEHSSKYVPLWRNLDEFHPSDKVISALQQKSKQDAGSNSIETVFTSRRRLAGIVRAISMEAADIPLYYDMAALCSRMHIAAPSLQQIQTALVRLGYRVTGSHARDTALKTDAPPRVVWDIYRMFEKGHPVNDRHKQNTSSPSAALLAQPMRYNVSFEKVDKHLLVDAHRTWEFSQENVADIWKSCIVPHDDPDLQKIQQSSKDTKKAVRFISNPGANWGPKTRATGYAQVNNTNVVAQNEDVTSKRHRTEENTEV